MNLYNSLLVAEFIHRPTGVTKRDSVCSYLCAQNDYKIAKISRENIKNAGHIITVGMDILHSIVNIQLELDLLKLGRDLAENYCSYNVVVVSHMNCSITKSENMGENLACQIWHRWLFAGIAESDPKSLGISLIYYIQSNPCNKGSINKV